MRSETFQTFWFLGQSSGVFIGRVLKFSSEETDLFPTNFPPTRQVDTPPTRKMKRRAADISFNIFNGNSIPPGCRLVRIFGLREVKWCGFLACVERIGGDFWSAWCGLVQTGADFCYWLVRLFDPRATLCSLAPT